MSCSDCNVSSQNTLTDSGRFGLCSTVWDSENSRFKSSNETEREWCCLNSCKSSTKACLEACEQKNSTKDRLECKNVCARNIILCEDMCALSTPDLWRGDSPLIKCIEDNGFGTYPNYDIQKIKENEQMLVSCCNEGCIPTSKIACVKHCSRKYDDLVGKSKDPLIALYDNNKILEDKHIVRSDNSLKYYLVTVGIILIFFIIIGVMKLKKK